MIQTPPRVQPDPPGHCGGAASWKRIFRSIRTQISLFFQHFMRNEHHGTTFGDTISTFCDMVSTMDDTKPSSCDANPRQSDRFPRRPANPKAPSRDGAGSPGAKSFAIDAFLWLSKSLRTHAKTGMEDHNRRNPLCQYNCDFLYKIRDCRSFDGRSLSTRRGAARILTACTAERPRIRTPDSESLRDAGTGYPVRFPSRMFRKMRRGEGGMTNESNGTRARRVRFVRVGAPDSLLPNGRGEEGKERGVGWRCRRRGGGRNLESGWFFPRPSSCIGILF